MAGSLLVLLDDIAYALDDVATMTKVAAKKTAGVLGDDLALNAEQVSGVKAHRELPIIAKVAKGSMINKAIIVPIGLGLSVMAPALIPPLLGIGGLYLCYEGVEAVIEKVKHAKESKEGKNLVQEVEVLSPEEEKKKEDEKIKGAIKTDFILSAEIIVIALGSFTKQPILTQAAALSTIAVGMTAGVYGSVAGIVKIDDMGLWLKELNKENFKEKMKELKDSSNDHSLAFKLISYPVTKTLGFVLEKGLNSDNGIKFLNNFGQGAINFMPKLMKTLSTLGTAAMFTVGGGILAHTLHHFGFNAVHHITNGLGSVATMGVEGALGLALGTAAVGVMHVKDKIVSLFKRDEPDSGTPSNAANQSTKTKSLNEPSKSLSKKNELEPKLEQVVIEKITIKPKSKNEQNSSTLIEDLIFPPVIDKKTIISNISNTIKPTITEEKPRIVSKIQ